MSQVVSPRATKKAHVFVSMDEVNPLISQLISRGFNLTQIAEMCGYTKSAFTDSKIKRTGGGYPKRLKMALIGVLAELGDTTASSLSRPDPGFTLDFDDATALFDACRVARKSFPVRDGTYKRLMGKLSQELVKLSK